jgi:hypothetical protein
MTPYEKAVGEALRRARLGLDADGHSSRLPEPKTAS